MTSRTIILRFAELAIKGAGCVIAVDRNRGAIFGVFGAVLIITGSLTVGGIAQVAKETPEPPSAPAEKSADSRLSIEALNGSAERKVESLIIPELNLQEATLLEGLDFLKRKSLELDPEKQGINFVVHLPDEYFAARPTPRITLNLRNIPMRDALKYVVNLANCKYRFDPHAIVILPMGDEGGLRQREYRLSTDLVAELMPPQSDALPGVKMDMFPYLKANDVSFPEGAAAVYIARSGRLLVRNTEENLDLVDELVAPFMKAAAMSSNPAEAKLAKLVFPKFELRETPLSEAIQILEKRVRESDPDKKGVKLDIVGELETRPPLITISLSNIPAIDVLKYASALGNRKFRFAEDNRIIVEPVNAVELVTKLYRVPAKSISTKDGTVKGPDGVTYASAIEFLSAFGVRFPKGASAGLPIDKEGIIIRNTPENHEIADAVIAAMASAGGGKLPNAELNDLRQLLRDFGAELR